MPQVQAEIAAAIAEAATADDWLRDHPPTVEFLSGVTGAAVDPASPLYRVAAEAVRAATGEAPFVNPLHTSSDIRNPILQAGIPTIGLGPLGGDLTQNGCTDEWVDVADYRRAAAVTAAIITGWCGAA